MLQLSEQVGIRDFVGRRYATLKSLFKVHVSRILVDNLEFFKVTCQDVAIRHVPHLYSRQMSMKSTVVSYENIVANCFIHICTCRYL